MAEVFRQQFSDQPDKKTQALRIPPHSIQAEQAVLGGLMLDNSTWDQVAGRVGKEDFYRREHQLIFEAIDGLAEASKPFDVVTLAEELERFGRLEEVGGLVYLGNLFSRSSAPAAWSRCRTGS